MAVLIFCDDYFCICLVFHSLFLLLPYKSSVQYKILWVPLSQWTPPCRVPATPPPPGRNPQSCLYLSICDESALGEPERHYLQ